MGAGRLDSGVPPGVVGAAVCTGGGLVPAFSLVSGLFWLPRAWGSLRGVLAGRAGLRDGWGLGSSVGWQCLRLGGVPAIPSTSLRAITPPQGGPGALVCGCVGIRAPLTRRDRASPGRRDGRHAPRGDGHTPRFAGAGALRPRPCLARAPLVLKGAFRTIPLSSTRLSGHRPGAARPARAAGHPVRDRT